MRAAGLLLRAARLVEADEHLAPLHFVPVERERGRRVLLRVEAHHAVAAGAAVEAGLDVGKLDIVLGEDCLQLLPRRRPRQVAHVQRGAARRLLFEVKGAALALALAPRLLAAAFALAALDAEAAETTATGGGQAAQLAVGELAVLADEDLPAKEVLVAQGLDGELGALRRGELDEPPALRQAGRRGGAG